MREGRAERSDRSVSPLPQLAGGEGCGGEGAALPDALVDHRLDLTPHRSWIAQDQIARYPEQARTRLDRVGRLRDLTQWNAGVRACIMPLTFWPADFPLTPGPSPPNKFGGEGGTDVEGCEGA